MTAIPSDLPKMPSSHSILFCSKLNPRFCFETQDTLTLHPRPSGHIDLPIMTSGVAELMLVCKSFGILMIGIMTFGVKNYFDDELH